MEVVFRTISLQRNYQDSAKAIRQWGPEVARKYISRINELCAIKNFHAAYSIQSLRLHALKGARDGELSIHLTGSWRLIVAKGDIEESVIVREVTNHYDG